MINKLSSKSSNSFKEKVLVFLKSGYRIKSCEFNDDRVKIGRLQQ